MSYHNTGFRSILLWAGMLLFFGFQTAFGFIVQQEAIPQNSDPEIINVISRGMDFDLPEQIPSGWTTFKYSNISPDVHFFVLQKMPEGKHLEDTKAEVIPVFTAAMNYINSGNSEQGFAEFNKLPAWFFDVVFTGGPGLISPSGTAQTTVHLEPGNYLLECYVKMPDGTFHSAMGMIAEVEVTEDANNNTEPEADCKISISHETGINFKDVLLPGEYTFAVEFKDQKPHENFVGHDVHLVKIMDDTGLKEINTWMNWSNPEAFKTPAPSGLKFLGGTQEMPAGETSYFTVNLSPGNYALVSEVPDPLGKNMLITFRVPDSTKKVD